MLPVSLQTVQRLLSQKAALSPHQAKAGLGQEHKSQCLALRTTWLASSYRYKETLPFLVACVSGLYYILTLYSPCSQYESWLWVPA